MKVVTWIRSRKRSVVSLAIAVTVATVLSVMAFTHEGFSTTDIDLHDGGVWVTKNSSSQLGHLNVAAQELDGGVTTRTSNFDVLQDSTATMLVDHQNSAIQVVDEAAMTLGAAVQVPPGTDVALNGGTVALLAPTGALYILPANEVSTFSAQSEPVAELGEGAVVTVSDSGTVVGVSLDDAAVTQWPVVDGVLGEPFSDSNSALQQAQELHVTTLGSTVVILDADNDRLLFNGFSVSVDDGAVLQHPGPAADAVALSTGTALIMQPLDGSAAARTVHADSGDAVAPVQMGGCVFGVWPGSDHFARSCADTAVAPSTSYDIGDTGDGPLVFRERYGQVVLNQVLEGNVWLVSDAISLVNNWEALLPETNDEDDDSDDESIDDEVTNAPPPPTEENSNPVANDDEFGARAGRATILPVLWNDTDADSDVLVLSVASVPDGITAAAVQNGSRIQVVVPADYEGGGFTLQYSVDDGRGGTDSATVIVTISSDGQNSPPQQFRQSTFEVEQSASLEYQTLQDWFDPDGDDMFLQSATPDSDDAVRTSPDGAMLYTASGSAGSVAVALEVSDGRGEPGVGVVDVTVSARNESTPIANTDYVETVPGVPVTVFPLRNDYVGGREAGRLAAVTAINGVEFVWDGDAGTVTVSNAPVGSYYLDYQLAVGPDVSPGRIRVDVRAPDHVAAPVAVRDVGLLRQGGSTLIDLLANDIDPAGGVLVVQSFTVGDAAPVSLELLERSIVRVTDNGLDQPLEFTYLVSNGTALTTGTVIVVPVAPTTQPRPPVAVPDTWQVREGDYTSIPITDNDFSPDGLEFSVSPDLLEADFGGDAAGSTAFIDGDQLRVHVPVGGPDEITLVYELLDPEGRSAAGTVHIDVVDRDTATNHPPTPVALEARVIAGGDVHISVPLDGIDPDGDRVTLVGQDTAPELGRIVETGAGFFVFHAEAAASGTVQFTYRVRDRWGADGTAIVQVGIAQPSPSNDPPSPSLDTITVLPNRAVSVDVLGNDSDPNGDQIALGDVPDGDIADVEIDVERQLLSIRAPSQPGEYVVPYTVSDNRGLSSQGTLIVEVSEDAEREAPIAVDDIVLGQDVVADSQFVVPVLANDRDPDGDPDDLQVAILSGPGTLSASGVSVVPNTEDFQIVTYSVTDIDGLSAEAFVEVPAASSPPPRISVSSIEVPSGVPTEIAVADVVTVATEHRPTITDPESVTATFAEGESWYVDEHTLSYQSEIGYRGEASITFAVTDGEGPDDPDGVTSLLTLPIVVVASSAVVPQFTSPSLEVGQGEDATVFSLVAATVDPDPGDLEAMRYEIVTGVSMPGVDVSIDGNRNLVAQASFDALPGDSGQLTVRVTDPLGNSVEGRIVITVSPSSMPLAEPRDDRADTQAGVPVTVPVLANDFNPFAQQGGALTIVGVDVMAGDAATEISGDSVIVTPGNGFAGTLQLRYRVQDRTETVQRERTANILVTVRDRPEPPSRANVQAVENAQVTLSWVPGGDNGSPIQSYIVEWAGGTQECASTTCVITGLQNGVEVTFTVSAVNEIGTSDPSPASAPARPDTKPDQPSAPRVERGDTSVALSWSPATTEGSPVTGYTVEISPPAPGNVTQQASTATSMTWNGLTNGVEYTFRIRAHSLAPDPSEWSEYSAAVVPAGPPLAPVQVVGTTVADQSTPTVRATWQSGGANGAAISHYLVTTYVNNVANGETRTTSTSLQQQFVYNEPVSVSFSVVAVNDVGESPSSAVSVPVRAVTSPGAPSVQLVTDMDGGSEIAVTPGASQGWSASELSYQVSIDGGAYVAMQPRGANWWVAASNTAHSIRVVTVTPPVNGRALSSVPSQAVTISPYGLPNPPTMTARVMADRLEVSITPPAPNGREIEYLQYQSSNYGLNNGPHAPQPTSFFEPIRDPDQLITMSVWAVDVVGQVSQPFEIRIDPQELTLNPGNTMMQPGTAVSGRTYVLSFQNLRAGTYTFTCRDSRGTFETGTWYTPVTNGSTSAYEVTFCVSRFAGEQTLILTSSTNGQSLTVTGNW